jgi:hypothetical protein
MTVFRAATGHAQSGSERRSDLIGYRARLPCHDRNV